MSEELLSVEDLSIEYSTRTSNIRAVTDATFTIEKGDYFGLLGESGCGKSTIAKAILGGLDENGRITSGRITYKGVDIQDYSEKQFREEIRWKEIAMIPQSPMTSLNPIQRLSDQAWELANTHTDWNKKKAMSRFEEVFEIVGIPKSRIHDYPFELSGGMQQRVLISLALYLKPSLIIADEPTTALDVIMQDQILEHLEEVKTETESSILMITHDISVLFENSQSLAVMHGGQVAETGSTKRIFEHPRHPYTILLKRAFPDIRFPNRELEVIDGAPPKLDGEFHECTFADRCPWAQDECRAEIPPLEPAETSGEHMVSCLRKDEIPRLAGEVTETESPQ